MQLSHRRKLILSIFFIVTIVVMFSILSEVFIRLRERIKHGGIIEDILVIDPSSQLRIPKASTALGPIKINSLGFRSPEIPITKPLSAVRLAFIGASTTFCAEVSSNETTWPHMVWKRLQESYPGVKFDYINAAVPGFTVAASLRNLLFRVNPLQPDIIIIYHATNDLSKDTRELAIKQGIYHHSEGEKDWFTKYSRLLYLLKKNVEIFYRQKEVFNHRKLIFNSAELSQGFRDRLRMLILESQKNAKLVAVATFSYKLRREQTLEEQVKAANTALYYMPYMSIEGLLDGYEEYNRVIKEVARETGALLIEDEMSIPGNDSYFKDSVHFTDIGSKLMAERVSDALLHSINFKKIIK